MIEEVGETSSQAERRRILNKTFLNPDPASVGVFNALNEVYPAFAKKIFENNELMKKTVLSGMNPINILLYPICGKCETLALPTTSILKNGKMVRRCGCLAKGCGVITVNPITFREWLRYELKRKMPKSAIEGIETAVDSVAMSMLMACAREMKALSLKNEHNEAIAMGLLDTDGNPVRQEKQEKKKKKKKPESESALRESWQKEGYNVQSI